MSSLPRFALAAAAAAAVLVGAGTGTARADAGAPSLRKERHRTCCALAVDLPLHLGSAHVPVKTGIVVAPGSIGHHSYSGVSTSRETNGVIYTRRGGFIDTGHTREYADLTAHLSVRLKELLARGEGELRLDPRDGEIIVRIQAPVKAELLERTSLQLARRIAFQVSVWVEISQHYGHTVLRGAEEYFSSFTPEDLYSNLLGTYLGVASVESKLPYDRAMDESFADALRSLEATPSTETRRVLDALAGRWWRASTPWPAAEIPILHSFDIGPHVMPALAPPDLVPTPRVPAVLDVPEHDEAGAPLADLYRLEIVPDLRVLGGLAGSPFRVVTGENLPLVVDAVRADVEAGIDAPRALPRTFDAADGHAEPLAHYIVGLRLLDLKAMGGVGSPPSGPPKGVGGGSLVAVRGDTRGGDFSLMHFGVGHAAERGLIGSFALIKADTVFFCHDPETHALRVPLLSLLGPCSPGEWLGVGGSIGEGFHDGDTGRTALRPISAYGVLDVLGNGQSASYDGLRLLLRGGAAVEHVWTAAAGGTTIPRAASSALFLARTPGRSLEATAAAGYRLDMTTPRDAAFESDVTLRWYFLLGGNPSAKLNEGVDPWGVASLGLDGSYSFWTRPAHSYADLTAPFVSAVQSGTWQLLLTATLGFEGLVY